VRILCSEHDAMSQRSGGADAFSVGGCLELAAAGILIVYVGPTRTVIATVRESRLRLDLIPAMAILASEGPTTSEYLHGALCCLSAVCIWAAFIVVSLLGVSTSLTPWDVAATRFAVAGVILLPYLLRRGLALDRLPKHPPSRRPFHTRNSRYMISLVHYSCRLISRPSHAIRTTVRAHLRYHQGSLCRSRFRSLRAGGRGGDFAALSPEAIYAARLDVQ
jgi:hypothetical protein